jgi:hypothetical protein
MGSDLLLFSATPLIDTITVKKWCREGGAMPVYEIRVKGHLDQHWSAWFDGMTITNEANGDTIISGPLVDQAALHSLLMKVYNLNLTLISVFHVGSTSRKSRLSNAGGNEN